MNPVAKHEMTLTIYWWSSGSSGSAFVSFLYIFFFFYYSDKIQSFIHNTYSILTNNKIKKWHLYCHQNQLRHFFCKETEFLVIVWLTVFAVRLYFALKWFKMTIPVRLVLLQMFRLWCFHFSTYFHNPVEI